jgi:hypothetical protein
LEAKEGVKDIPKAPRADTLELIDCPSENQRSEKVLSGSEVL